MGRSPIVKGAKKEQRVRQMLLGKEPIRAISRETGFSRKAIETYRDESLPEKLVKAKGIEEVAEANTLLDDIKGLREKATSILEQAEKAGDLKTALLGIREARGCIELLAKVEGQINDRPQINITLNAEWIELRTLIIRALEPFPDAKAAVISAIH